MDMNDLTFRAIQARRAQIQENILKGYNSELEDAIEEHSLLAKGELEIIEKAVYANTSQNRRLGRVGQEYHRGKGKKDAEQQSSGRGRKALSDALESYYDAGEDWSAEDDNNFVKKIADVVKKHGLTKKDFTAAMRPHRDEIDLSWDDVAPSEQTNGKKALKKELMDIAYFTSEKYNEDETNEDRHNRWASRLAKVVKDNNVSKEDYEKVHKNFGGHMKSLTWDNIQKHL